MRVGFFLLVVLTACAVTSAQLTPEEAYEKLRQKQKEKDAAAASQPAETPEARPSQSGVLLGLAIHKGWDALTAHRYADGAAMFELVIKPGQRDPVALQGRGICKYELKEYKLADRDLQEAYGISGGDPTRMSRQLVIAAAAASIADANPMRAAKSLQTLMESLEQNGKLDEELQNDLGIALAHVDAQAKKLPRFEDALRYYMDYDTKLNHQKNDSTSRWGTQWLSRASAEEKWKQYKDSADAVTSSTSNYQHCSLAREHAYDNYLEIVGGLRLHGTLEIQQRTEEYKQSVKVEAAAKRQMIDAVEHMKSVEKPPFPDRIEYDWKEPR